ncbi:MAG: hypothetical protein QW065_04735, partial [Acidilobaceae archaeon]
LAPLLHEYRASRYIKFSSNEEADQVFFEVASALISGYDFVIVSFNELTSSYIKAFCDKLSRLVPGLQVEQEGFEVKISTLGERSSRTLETRVSLVVKLLAEALKSPDKLSLAVLAFSDFRKTVIEYELHKRSSLISGVHELPLVSLRSLSVILHQIKDLTVAYRTLRLVAESPKTERKALDSIEVVGSLLADLFWSIIKVFNNPSEETYRGVLRAYSKLVKEIEKSREFCSEEIKAHLENILVGLEDLMLELGIYVSVLKIASASFEDTS